MLLILLNTIDVMNVINIVYYVYNKLLKILIKTLEIIFCSIIGSVDGLLDASGAHTCETLLNFPQSSTNNLDVGTNNDIGRLLINLK